MKLKAYAKINLCLKNKGIRNDGYHELEMIMINISLYDILTFKKDNIISVKMSNNACNQEDNIVYKVAMLMKKQYNVDDGAKIYIKKRIPDGGGLGGGSSDAATTIIALNKMWKLNLNQNQMENIANAVGSDVCFFLYNKLSLIQGRGEIVKPLNKSFNKKIILIFPDVKCSTKKVYEFSNNIESMGEIEPVISNIDSNDCYNYLFNDLEAPALLAYPDYKLNDIKEYVKGLNARFVQMSGSGSTIYAIVDNYKSFNKFKKHFKDYSIIKSKTISYCKRY